MVKKEIPPKTLLYPMPAALVGANVNGKPNFLTVAYCGIVNLDPPKIAVALGKAHYTNPGVRENKTFSVNVPSTAMAAVTDFCGLNSGSKVDKSGVFEVFYGKLGTAPMIEKCPVNLECRLESSIALEVDEVFIGEIVAVYVNDDCLTGDKPDILKIDPLIFSISDKKYFAIGKEVGKAWSIGKEYKKE